MPEVRTPHDEVGAAATRRDFIGMARPSVTTEPLHSVGAGVATAR